MRSLTSGKPEAGREPPPPAPSLPEVPQEQRTTDLDRALDEALAETFPASDPVASFNFS